MAVHMLRRGITAVLLLVSLAAAGQEPAEQAQAAPPPPPRSNFAQQYTGLEFVGIYYPDGTFKSRRNIARFVNFEAWPPGDPRFMRPDIPEYVNLRSLESVVEDFHPPVHVQKPMMKTSFWRQVRDTGLSWVYGLQLALVAPTHIVTDSKDRVIVSDPGLPAVHVLDGKSSFRIAGGAKYRLQAPAGVAVDASDNIYIADAKRGCVLVYDPLGRYQRCLGNFKGESMFDSPTGIAVDKKLGLVYVLDSPMNQMVVLDLLGNVVKRLGEPQMDGSKVQLLRPTEVAVADGRIVVLDSDGTRIHIFDPDLNVVNEFKVRNVNGPPDVKEIGLALDSMGAIFITNLTTPNLRVFSQKGEFLGWAGYAGHQAWEFMTPAGIWIDPKGRVFITDSWNSRVQVFQQVPTANPNVPIPAVATGTY